MDSTYTSINTKEAEDIAAAYLQSRISKTKSQAEPIMVLVGGQAGAGKSAASAIVREEMTTKGGFIHVDADRLREKLNAKGTNPSSEETQADAGRLVQELRKQAIKEKINLIEEGTYRNPEGVAAFIAARKNDGYKVELVAVATPSDESMLGIYQRHEMQHKAGATNPRFVKQDYHDESFNGFKKTLLHNETVLDRVRVINRSGELLYDSKTPENNKHKSAVEAMTEGQKLTPSKINAISESYQVIKQMAVDRNAPPDYLSSLAKNQERISKIQVMLSVVDKKAEADGLSQQQRDLVSLRTLDNIEKNTVLGRNLPEIKIQEEQTLQENRTPSQDR